MAGMRAIQNLDVSLGLFGFQTKVYKGTNDPSEGVSFRQVHTCGTPIHQVKRCAACALDLSQSDLRKGYEYSPGHFAVFTDDEVKSVRPEKTGVLKVDGYLAADAVDPAYMTGSVYYLSPAGKDHTTFATFREALGDRWAVGKVVMYGREHVAVMRAVEKVLGLHLLRPTSELRTVDGIPQYDKVPETVKPEYVSMMSQLMNKGATTLDDVVIESDSYVDAVKAMVDARLAGEPAPATPAPAPVPQADNLLAMLQASLAATK